MRHICTVCGFDFTVYAALGQWQLRGFGPYGYPVEYVFCSRKCLAAWIPYGVKKLPEFPADNGLQKFLLQSTLTRSKTPVGS